MIGKHAKSSLPFSLADVEAMRDSDLDAIDAAKISSASPSLAAASPKELRDFAEALSLLNDHKQYSAQDAAEAGDLESAERHAATANAAKVVIAEVQALLNRQ